MLRLWGIALGSVSTRRKAVLVVADDFICLAVVEHRKLIHAIK